MINLNLIITAMTSVFVVGLLPPVGFAQTLNAPTAQYTSAPTPYTGESATAIIEAFEAYQEAFPNTTREDWGSPTPDSIAAQAQAASVLKQRIVSTAEADLPPSQRISLDIIERILTRDINDFAYDTARIPFTGDYGFHMLPVMAAFGTRIKTVQDAELWIEQLEAIPAYLNTHKTNIRRGLDAGFTAHIDPVNATIAQLYAQIDADHENSDFFAPFLTLPEDVSGIKWAQIMRRAKKATTNASRAYKDLHGFFVTEYLPKARPSTGISSVENGRALYAAVVSHHTTLPTLAPETIHQIGQSEVARIKREMYKIVAEVEFEGSLQDFIAMLRTDPRFYARSETELLGHAALLSKRLDALLPEYFSDLPRLTYGVFAVPASYAANYTTGRYQSGDWAEGKAGRYMVNTHRLDQRPLYELPALSAHEAVPGHHLQIALAQEIGDDYPEFRQNYYANAFGEGWALYAEKLVGEAGFYQTPYERFGQLSYEMWRACRLVVDTGIHLYNWTREEARACFRDNTALAPHNIETEITRYIGWPGQAVSYKIGELKILELRQRAMDALGDGFDIRAFHAAVLGQGSMPLPALEITIDAWIDAQLALAEAALLPAADDMALTAE